MLLRNEVFAKRHGLSHAAVLESLSDGVTLSVRKRVNRKPLLHVSGQSRPLYPPPLICGPLFFFT